MILDIQDIINSVSVPALIKDEFVKRGTFARLKNGDLQACVGGFSIVFPVVVDGVEWAFRCWHTTVDDSESRYRHIGLYLNQLNIPYFCSFSYASQGIVVNGRTWATTRMRWVDGLTIKEYICRNVRDSQKITRLADSFLKMCLTLHEHHIAHGDLQHGNIIVSGSGNLYLVDYDSLYVPSMRSDFRDVITGLVDYQHPSRKSNRVSSDRLDFFSELVIYLSIIAIAEKPSLVNDYKVQDTEALLFKAEDYADFRGSKIYRELSGLSSTVRQYLSLLESYLKESDISALQPFTSDAAIGQAIEQIERLRNEDENDWSFAERAGTKYGYWAYLRNHPNGRHVAECRARLSAFEDQEDWHTTERTDTLAAYQLYLQNHPNGRYRNLAQSRISQFQDDTNWRAALAANTISAIENYRRWFPYGRHISECDSIIEGLMWQEALRKNTLKSYQDYLDRYPYGNHSIDAGSAIVKLKAKERERRERERELKAWHSAETANTISAYRGYLEEFGDNARHSEDAKRAIAELKSSEGKGWVVMLFIILICALIVWFIIAQTNSDQAIPSGRQVPDSGYNPSYVDHSAEIRQIKESLDNWLPGKEAAHKNGLSVGNLSPWQNKIDKLKDYGDPSWKKYQDRIDKLK